jgi:hypothetical protein
MSTVNNRRYRKIDPRIWNDAKFRALRDPGKLFFLFILTHPHLTPLGAMRATVAGLAEELGWALKATRSIFQEILGLAMIKFDQGASCLVVPNFLKYNPPESSNVVKAWVKAMDWVPECSLKDELIQNIKLFLNAFHKDFLQAFAGGLGEVMREPGTETDAEEGTEDSPCAPPLAGEERGSIRAPKNIEDEKKTKIPSTTPVQLVGVWNAINPIPGMEPVELISERRKKVLNRLKEHSDLEWWRVVIQKIKDSPFLRGETGTFRATFDWIIKSRLNAQKIYEGSYDASQEGNNKPRPSGHHTRGRSYYEGYYGGDQEA